MSEIPLPEFTDVLIVGAGLSGIGAACHLTKECPNRSFAIVEARPQLGGTWDLFRYPGIRSDSDMFTLGFEFKPWSEPKAIADGPSILKYLQETAAEYHLDDKISFNRRVTNASWDTSARQWSVEISDVETNSSSRVRCSFLFINGGYYRYDVGYLPDFDGMDDFGGELIHPQFWPEDFDPENKKIVVIGSGATAVTLVPALAKNAGHVTQLQRSPTYILTAPDTDRIADRLRNLLPAKIAYALVRGKNVIMSVLTYQLCQRFPGFVKRQFRKGLAAQLPDGFDIDTHFTPSYDPWDQRVCLDPNGLFFKAIREGKVDVVTDTIERFTPRGILLSSGRELEADVIVTATGLTLQVLGGIKVDVDGVALEPGSSVSYRGMMFDGVPNLAYTVGYTNASWTLKSDLVAHYVCRLLNYMADHGFDAAAPTLHDGSMPRESSFNLSSGYIQRGQDQIPRQGTSRPWKLKQIYPIDVIDLRFGKLTEDMRFSAKQRAGLR
jgi:monooxygenase